MTASHEHPFPSGSGCPQTEVTSLQEATPRGRGSWLSPGRNPLEAKEAVTGAQGLPLSTKSASS